MNKNLDLNPVRCRCGGEAETIVIHRTDGRIVYFVKCVDCGIETPEFYVEAEAVTVWNRAMGTDRCCNTCDIYEDGRYCKLWSIFCGSDHWCKDWSEKND